MLKEINIKTHVEAKGCEDGELAMAVGGGARASRDGAGTHHLQQVFLSTRSV